jgi:hypothetical protein
MLPFQGCICKNPPSPTPLGFFPGSRQVGRETTPDAGTGVWNHFMLSASPHVFVSIMGAQENVAKRMWHVK